MPTRNVCQVLCVAKCGRKQRRQGRHRPVHQSGEPRLHDLQHEHAPARLLLGLLGARREMLGAEPLGERDVRALRLGQIAQELAHARIGGARHRALVEAPGFELHGLGLLAHPVEAQRPHDPQWLVPGKAPHVMAADERDVLAEFRAVHLDEPAPVLVLLRRHIREHLGRGGEVGLQPFRIVGVDARVLLLGRDGERQDLLLCQLRECLHRFPPAVSISPSRVLARKSPSLGRSRVVVGPFALELD